MGLFRGHFRSYPIFGLVAVALIALSCKPKTPKGGTPTPTPPVGSTPTPNPGVRYPGLPSSCQNLVSRTHGNCIDTWNTAENPGPFNWEHEAVLDQSLSQVTQSNPNLMDGDRVPDANRPAYIAKLVESLNSKGICSSYDGDKRLYVRQGNPDDDYSESYLIFNGPGRPVSGGHWICDVSDEIPGSRPGFACNLQPQTEAYNCGGSQRNFLNDVSRYVRAVIAEELAKGSASLIIDSRFKKGHTDPVTGENISYRLKDDGYPFLRAVATKANAEGYCITSNGWKWLAFKKGSNAVSETYSLITMSDEAAGSAIKPACDADGINNHAPPPKGDGLTVCEWIYLKPEETCQPSFF